MITSMRTKAATLLAVLITAATLCLGAAVPPAYADDPIADDLIADLATPAPIDLATATVDRIPAATYDGYEQTPDVYLSMNGSTLYEGLDYTVAYRNNINAGTAQVIATGIGDYKGTVTSSFTIKPARLSSVEVASKTFTYTGKMPKVKVTVTAADDVIAYRASKSTKNIKLTVPAKAKKVGKHTITVKGKGNYTGTKTVTIKVYPKKTSITSLKGGDKSFTVKWKRPANDISGYDVRYSLYSDMEPSHVKTVSKSSATKNIGGLQQGTKYYVQVRAFKNVGGKKYVSGWSAKKSVKTKAAPKPKASSGGTVYITATGDKYHRGTCRYLRYSKYAISKAEAQNEGYTACLVCRP